MDKYFFSKNQLNVSSISKSTVYGGYWFWRPNERGRVSSTLLDEDIIARSNRKTSLVPHSYRFPLCVNIRKSLSERWLKTRMYVDLIQTSHIANLLAKTPVHGTACSHSYVIFPPE